MLALELTKIFPSGEQNNSSSSPQVVISLKYMHVVETHCHFPVLCQIQRQPSSRWHLCSGKSALDRKQKHSTPTQLRSVAQKAQHHSRYLSPTSCGSSLGYVILGPRRICNCTCYDVVEAETPKQHISPATWRAQQAWRKIITGGFFGSLFFVQSVVLDRHIPNDCHCQPKSILVE